MNVLTRFAQLSSRRLDKNTANKLQRSPHCLQCVIVCVRICTLQVKLCCVELVLDRNPGAIPGHWNVPRGLNQPCRSCSVLLQALFQREHHSIKIHPVWIYHDYYHVLS